MKSTFSLRLCENWEDGFERVVGFVTVALHTEAVCKPQCNVVGDTIFFHPVSISSHVVITVCFHVMEHPSSGLSVAVVPCAETSTFFGPKVDHFVNMITWVCEGRGDEECE